MQKTVDKISNLHVLKTLNKLGLERIFHTIGVLYDNPKLIYSMGKTQGLSLENKKESKDVHAHQIFTTKL